MDPCLLISVKVDCYVDTNFAIIWNAEDNPDPYCVNQEQDMLFALVDLLLFGEENYRLVSQTPQWKPNTLR